MATYQVTHFFLVPGVNGQTIFFQEIVWDRESVIKASAVCLVNLSQISRGVWLRTMINCLAYQQLPASNTSMSLTEPVGELFDVARGARSSARDELMVVVYEELHRLAGIYLKDERRNHTLQPTALVHEAYLRLVAQGQGCWKNREHFIGVAALMMRRILVNYAYRHKRTKRGGGEPKLSLSEADQLVQSDAFDVTTLDEALERLAKEYPQESRVVELRVFGGLSVAATANLLGISESTVKRDWKFAKVWLVREMSRR
jgi:RNA polymerase sigma factor (TIGR02999 family)